MMETLAVIVFVAGIFTFIYISILPLMGTYNDLIVRENDIDIVYKLYNIRSAIQKDNRIDLEGETFIQLQCSDFRDVDYCNNLMLQMDLAQKDDTNNITFNYLLYYTSSIKDNIDSFTNAEIKTYLDKHKDETNPTLILMDTNKKTIAHLDYFREVEPTAYGEIKRGATFDETIDFGKISSDTNGKGVYILPGTEDDENPIYYYRGEVDNNNVIFGGFCWQIVRTTETGGIKMIYNGVTTGTNDNPTCEKEVGTERQFVSKSAFNTNFSSVSDVGYMYNKRYENSRTIPTTGAYFGSGVTYDDTTNTYTLTGADVTGPDASHHYSCDLTDPAGSCETVRYYYYVSGSSYFHIKLKDGELIEDALYKMTGNGSSETKARAINQNYELNTTNSTIKTVIDTWYQNNLTSYTNYLEDTVYCNDRSFQENGSNTLLKSGWNPNADNTTGNGGLTTYIYFNARTRWSNSSWYSTTNVPVFTCPKKEDRFTVSSEKGNGKLTYPIGLLTTDEVILAGAAGDSTTNNNKYYLYSKTYWGLSPSGFSINYASVLTVYSTGYLYYNSVNNTNDGVRPAVSLKPGTEFESGGNGTPTNPYIVKYD